RDDTFRRDDIAGNVNSRERGINNQVVMQYSPGSQLLGIQIRQSPCSTLIGEPAFENISANGVNDDTIMRTLYLVAFNQNHALFATEVVIAQQAIFFHQAVIGIEQCRDGDKRIGRADENRVFGGTPDFQVVAASQDL